MQADSGLQRGRPGSEIVDGGARPARSDSRARSEEGIEEIGQEAEGGWFSVRLQRQTIGQGAQGQQLFRDCPAEHQRQNVQAFLGW